MKTTTLLSVSFFVAAAVAPAALHAQGYQQGPSITIPVPGFGNQPQRRDHEQESELRDRHCADMEHREGELRERLEHARYGNDRERLESELHEVRENLHGECHR